MERMRGVVVLAVSLLVFIPAGGLRGAEEVTKNWPQFRGPNASGIAAGERALPVEFGADKNVAWKTALPAGHSSPCIWGERIFLTGFTPESRKLEVLCLDRRSGKILWRRAVPAGPIEKVHAVSNPATATPATDGERVFVYFGSCGLLCFDFAGEQKWNVPLPVAQTRFGSGTSPIVAGELVVLNRETGSEAYLLAVDRRTGKTVWKQQHVPTPQGAGECYATPVVWQQQVVVHRAGEVAGFDLRDGKRRWSVRANTSGTSSPVVTETAAYVATWNNFGEADQRPNLPDFATLLKQHDKNGDGRISEDEFPADLYLFRRPEADTKVTGTSLPLKRYFKDFLDGNKNGLLEEAEWQGVVASMAAFVNEHGLLAIRPGGEGDVSGTHVRWRENRSVPEVPTPLVYRDRVYMLRDGGVVSCMEAQTGKLLYRERLGAGGSYYASPVAAGDRIYAASGEGKVVVFKAGDRLEVLGRNDLQEPIMATPGIADGQLYVRTAGYLYAFAAK
jgi:outer membrane protein assembly factor BamB